MRHKMTPEIHKYRLCLTFELKVVKCWRYRIYPIETPVKCDLFDVFPNYRSGVKVAEAGTPAPHHPRPATTKHIDSCRIDDDHHHHDHEMLKPSWCSSSSTSNYWTNRLLMMMIIMIIVIILIIIMIKMLKLVLLHPIIHVQQLLNI